MLNHLSFPNDITLIYGAASTGKTTVCFHMTAKNSGKVIFIDTENSFNIKRIQEINPTVDINNIILWKATRFSEQFQAIKNLSKVKNLSLVIIDSFTHFYRRKLQEKVTIKPVTIRMLKMLKELDCPCILTSQVYSRMDGKTKAIGSDLFQRYAKLTIELQENEKRRTARVGKKYIPFKITNQGCTEGI